MPSHCKHCEKEFTPTKVWQEFCTAKCRNNFHQQKHRASLRAARDELHKNPLTVLDPIMSKIYVIQLPDLDAYKIGYSTDPEIRLRDLQTSLPCDLHLIVECPVHIQNAPRIERAIHLALTAHHIKREWFRAPITLIISTIETIIAPYRVGQEETEKNPTNETL